LKTPLFKPPFIYHTVLRERIDATGSEVEGRELVSSRTFHLPAG